ncbi:MAG: ATP-dependent DNA helicase RecQ [Clostridia bacterium]|nr:ATP-dependent DNA helicase RecQ [Clostridia bacterium]
MRKHLKRACLDVLGSTFGLTGFRPGQEAAAHALLSGRDLLCILPTGAGKSLCWQLPAVMKPGLTVVVSPLIALMRDQVQRLTERGIAAAALNSLMLPQERERVMADAADGRIRIIFVSPERLETKAFRSLCRDAAPWQLVVDEAHCIVQWGREFRAAYQHIGDFINCLPRRPVICAMTATADRDMQRAITDALALHRPKRVMLPALRDNLTYAVHTTLEPFRDIARLVREAEGKITVFCRTRARTEALAAYLRACGCAAEYYHAGLEREERHQVQQRFADGQTQVLAATTAFGMGVDIADIRLVIHDHLPDSVIDYVQQSGRAGRNGRAAQCVIMLTPDEFLWHEYHLDQLRREHRWHPVRGWLASRRAWLTLRQMLRVCLTARCIPQALGRAFGQRSKPCGCCRSCRSGAQMRTVPYLPAMSRQQVMVWLLAWQRDAAAKKHGLPKRQIATTAQLKRAARRLQADHLPPPGQAELQRMLDYFRNE